MLSRKKLAVVVITASALLASSFPLLVVEYTPALIRNNIDCWANNAVTTNMIGPTNIFPVWWKANGRLRHPPPTIDERRFNRAEDIVPWRLFSLPSFMVLPICYLVLLQRWAIVRSLKSRVSRTFHGCRVQGALMLMFILANIPTLSLCFISPNTKFRRTVL